MKAKSKGWLRRQSQKKYVAATLLVLVLSIVLVVTAFAGTPLSIAGYLDSGYPDTVREPTEGRSEHKLWHHDGLWWASIFSTQAGGYTIHRLDWNNQTWVNTGVMIDSRPDSRSDALLDGNKLYIASYVKQENPSPVNSAENWGRLYRFSYDDANDRFTLDSGFPVVGITQDKTKVLSLEKDSQGRLWIAYVSRPTGTSTEYQVYVRSSIDSDTNWNPPLPLVSIFPGAAMVAVTSTENKSDVVGLIAFEDNAGPKLGVMWSNERAGVNKFFFAIHPDTSAYNAGWIMDADNFPYTANDHLNLAKTSNGQVFAAVKTSATTTGDALNAVIARDRNGSYSFHTVNPVESNDTKPIVVIYEPGSGPDKAYVFMSSNPTGGKICAVEAEITSTLSNMDFPVRNCGSVGLSAPPVVIGDSLQYTLINNPTTTRQILNEGTDIVLLAADQTNNVYVHTVVVDPPEGPAAQSVYLFLPAVRK